MKFIFLILLLAINMTYCYGGEAQLLNADIQKVVNDSMKSKWYEKIQIKGYVHFRYNRLMETTEFPSIKGCLF